MTHECDRNLYIQIASREDKPLQNLHQPHKHGKTFL